jgi:glycosyltransferase involved in cell wall biosynthesis
LAEQCRIAGASQVTVVGNAVPAAFVAACRDAVVPEEIRSLPRPVLGYVGTIARWLDADALRWLAEAFPHGTVLLVGPVEQRPTRLPANVVLLGERPHEQLPGILRGLDLGLVPFLSSPLIDAVNPVKVYEYWAAGLPVLSTPFAEAQRLRPGVVVAPASEWPRSARELLASPPLGLVSDIPTWEERARVFCDLLE